MVEGIDSQGVEMILKFTLLAAATSLYYFTQYIQ